MDNLENFLRRFLPDTLAHWINIFWSICAISLVIFLPISYLSGIGSNPSIEIPETAAGNYKSKGGILFYSLIRQYAVYILVFTIIGFGLMMLEKYLVKKELTKRIELMNKNK